MRVVIVIGSVLVLQILSGCAFSPQAVRIQPTINASSSAIGAGKAVQVLVVDERPRATLGTRGAQGVGAELTISGDLATIVRSAIADGLSKKGFKPTTGQTEDDRVLRVEIRNLDYRIVVGFWAGSVSTECGLKGICIRGTSRPHEALHRGEYRETIVVVQGDAANNRYVNAAVSDAISKLLEDQQLMQCLSTP